MPDDLHPQETEVCNHIREILKKMILTDHTILIETSLRYVIFYGSLVAFQKHKQHFSLGFIIIIIFIGSLSLLFVLSISTLFP